MARRRVALLFGGRSVEHEVSIVSARGIAEAFRETTLEIVPIAVTSCGRWLPTARSAQLLQSDVARIELPAGEGYVAPAPGVGLVEIDTDGSSRLLEVDVLFPIMHGWGGEDGRLQGALELSGVPYVGAGVGGSAVGMDKVFTRRLCEQAGLPLCDWLACDRDDLARDSAAIQKRILDELGLPVFVKPANGGSSVGVIKVEEADSLGAALEEAAKFDRRLVIEKAHNIREIECAVLGNADAEASVLGEIMPSNDFYDYAAKYVDNASALQIPAELSAEITASIRALALRTFRTLDLAGFARIDFFVERDGDGIWLNEVNTLPGFTPISMFPKLWDACGLHYPQLIERLVELALEVDRGQPPRH
jgi:D-alanine-D-alanine ligase